MAGRLTPEQQQELLNQLQQMDGVPSDDGGELPPEAQQEAAQQGMAMAQAAAEAGAMPGADASGQQAPAPEVDASAQTLAKLGFASVDELAQAFEAASQGASQYKGMLAQLLAFQQAEQNEDDLDQTAPDYAIRKAIRDEMAPVHERLREDARNQMIQDAWGRSALDLPGISDEMPDIKAFLEANPHLATSEDGLRRAYEGVRSKKYRSEKEMLDDPEFIKRFASDERIKKAVLESHLGEIARLGDALPATIGDGGGTPLTGKRRAPTEREQARAGLLKMLGG